MIPQYPLETHLYHTDKLALIVVPVHIGYVELTADAVHHGVYLLSVVVGQSGGSVLPHKRLDRIGNDWTSHNHRPTGDHID